MALVFSLAFLYGSLQGVSLGSGFLDAFFHGFPWDQGFGGFSPKSFSGGASWSSHRLTVPPLLHDIWADRLTVLPLLHDIWADGLQCYSVLGELN